MSVALRIPLEGEPDLPWEYFLLQAARGGVRVRDWVWLAVPKVIGEQLGLSPEQVTGEDVDTALKKLPADPWPLLRGLCLRAEVEPPEMDGDLRVPEGAALGSFRQAVDQGALLHDAVLQVLVEYSVDGFYACTEALDEENWNARDAVAAMLYLMLLRSI